MENSTKQVWQKEALPAGSLADSALDLVAAQPLQEMGFVAEQVRAADLVGGSSWSLGMELNLEVGSGSDKPPADQVMGGDDSRGNEGLEVGSGAVWRKAGMEEEFPPLNKETLRVGKGRDGIRGMEGKEPLIVPGQGEKENPKLDRNREELRLKVDGNKGKG